MTVVNGYCSLNDFKAYITSPGIELNPDNLDDQVIEDVIVRASRRLDDLTGRRFYPRIETRYYNTPKYDVLSLDDDLLDVITLTNGDGSTIASSDYVLQPINEYPKYEIKLRDIATIYFTLTNASSRDKAIILLAYWGWRDRYAAEGWKLGSTINEAGNLNATDINFTLSSGVGFTTDQIIKIENELMIVSGISGASGNDINVIARGSNGSSAATHANSTAVYIWQPQDDITALALEIARIMYRSRYGENIETTAITTPAGVIVTPRSLPVWAQEVIGRYQRLY